MKLNHLIPQRHRNRIIRQFGAAKLVRRADGQHELIGGSDTDRHEAFEWVSLFAHEIVFTHFYGEVSGRCEGGFSASRLRAAF